MPLLYSLAIGALAGFLAGAIMKGKGAGLLGNLVIGILGGLLGGWVAGLVGIGPDGSLPGQLAIATGGAVLLLFLVGLVKREKK